MGSFKWGSKSPNMVYISIVILLITLLTTTREPPSRLQGLALWSRA